MRRFGQARTMVNLRQAWCRRPLYRFLVSRGRLHLRCGAREGGRLSARPNTV